MGYSCLDPILSLVVFNLLDQNEGLKAVYILLFSSILLSTIFALTTFIHELVFKS